MYGLIYSKSTLKCCADDATAAIVTQFVTSLIGTISVSIASLAGCLQSTEF